MLPESSESAQEEVHLSVSASSLCSDVYVSANASVAPSGSIESIVCTLYDMQQQAVWQQTAYGSDAKWEIYGKEGQYTLVVAAISESGAFEQWQQELTLENGAFIWPLEPQYQMLLHDRYQVSSGSSTIGGYTHNNGLMRQKHYVYGGRRNHYALDITAAPGSEVAAVSDGKVLGIYTDTDSIGSTSYGKYLIIRHSDKLEGRTVYTLYAHLSKAAVKSGQSVKQGDIIAYSGNTGGSRIPHLHLEVRLGGNDKAYCIDPLEVLPERNFANFRSTLEPEYGFPSSSITLHAQMLECGWDYAIPGRLLRQTHGISAGTEVEIISRSGSTVKFRTDSGTYSCPASALEYTFER